MNYVTSIHSHSPAILGVLRVLVAVGLCMYLGGQVKKPTRFVGRIFASLMNVTHSKMTDWALAQIPGS